ncbi:hypothetical protein ACEPAH_796 [Sanghuangporus vaninii]
MSNTVVSSTEPPQNSSQNAPSVDALVEGLEKTALENDAQDTQAAVQQECAESRLHIVYTRKQLVFLSQSPLVKLPEGMPEFKVWFGELNEQALLSLKKDSDSVSSNGAVRERRFRREPEDSDGSTRPQFRSGLSQPSQMGNFKHQPLRSSDRDRDTERDLRSLSDRYDRDKATRGDRMGLGSHSTLLRTRDRDSAPHLPTDREGQRTLGRKRNGESKEDWRRGAEPPRSGRDDNNSRRDRDDRERQRSRVRDNSRTRDSPPATRREREEQRKDRDRDRFDEADGDRKKLSSRREKDSSGREKDSKWEHSREPGTDRDGWTITDDKRRGARDRRHDDTRDKEDKREREKEKEPAWMETYVPPVSSSSGILGGKGGDGELDSIQAWKKDMKEREMKAKGLVPETSAPTVSSNESAVEEAKPSQAPSVQPEGQLDEIQLFKLMMKKEQERTASGNGNGVLDERHGISDIPLKTADPCVRGSMGVQEARTTASTDRVASPAGASPVNGISGSIDPLLAAKSTAALKPPSSAALAPSPSGAGALPSLSENVPSSALSNGPRLLSLKTSETTTFQETVNKDAPGSTASFDPPRTSRLLAFGAQSTKVTAQPSPQSAAAAVQMNRLQQMDPLWPNQRRTSVSPAMPHSASQQAMFDKPVMQQQMLTGGQFDMNVSENLSRRPGLDSLGYNPLYENAPRSANALDASREITNIDTGRSSIPLSASERTVFMSQSDSLQHLADARRIPTPPTAGYGVTSPISPFDSQMSNTQNSYSSGKGSRMAKHFERQRDQSLINVGRNPPLSGLGPNGMMQNRQEQTPTNNPMAAGEGRNLQDLLTMLNNSAQAQRHHLSQNMGQHQPAQSLHIGPTNASLGRIDHLLDNDEGRFAPDGLVPGLRPAVPPGPRNREMSTGSLYANQLDEQIAFNARLGAQQRGGMDHLITGQIPSQFNGQGMNAGRASLSLQQQAMRGGPSPINNFNPAQGLPQQRLPPGLANLGSRPPHEPSQFLTGGTGNFGGVPSQLPAGLQHGSNPQAFNQFQNPGLGMVGNQTHLRGQPGLGQLGNNLNGLEFRGGPSGPTQNQLLGLGAPNLGQAMRGGSGFHAQQLHGPNQLHPSINIRQQQNIQPQMLQQLLPQQLQAIPPGQHNPNDLMALLMGNAHRE